MQFKRFLEVGRIVIVNFGPSNGKIGVIIDIIDKNRSLIDGWVGRQIINNKRITLTRTVIKISKSISSHKLKKSLNKNKNLFEKLNQSLWFQKFFLKEKKKLFNDFEKFKYSIGKRIKNL
nr:60S ribosomal protein L14A [Cryptomonas curvata]